MKIGHLLGDSKQQSTMRYTHLGNDLLNAAHRIGDVVEGPLDSMPIESGKIARTFRRFAFSDAERYWSRRAANGSEEKGRNSEC